MSLTDPDYYSSRDLLLFSQLLHTYGLILPESVENYDNMDMICQKCFDHQSTRLSVEYGLEIEKPWTAKEAVELYKKLLEKYECGNSTELANIVYAERVRELEAKVGRSQEEFSGLLEGEE